ncbi:MAG: DUF2148 domain-containing protein [Oscillospiraceae bacterium]|nr:DUF2148 domain-containing protein [Oscillospiraceae bacterium]
MIYKSEMSEKNAIMQVAELMTAAARTAPKACGIDVTETLIVDGDDKDKLSASMRKIGIDKDRAFFLRDAGNVDNSTAIVLIGTAVSSRGLNCGLCGMRECSKADDTGVPCTMAVNDLGIAGGSAASIAMDNRIDNRMLFSAGMAALDLKLFSDKVKLCFGIPLSVSGKNIFFDRKGLQ